MTRQGKFSDAFMSAKAYAHLGKRSRKVIVGPASGLDNGVVSLGVGEALVVTTDPISVVPEMGMELSAKMSVHLVASDFASSGVTPEFATFSYNFPELLSEKDCGEYLEAIGRTCGQLGITIVGGHTGTYPGAGFTVVGAGTMFGACPEDEFVTPEMAGDGDEIVMTKGAGIEAATFLAWSFPRTTQRRVGEELARRAKALVEDCSTVADARSASRVGLRGLGVTSMHDATEGGVLGALGEMARAAGKRFVVEKDLINVSEEAGAVCSAFGLDPLRSLSEGTLIITCNHASLGALKDELSRSGVRAAAIGRVERGPASLQTGDGRQVKPGRDEYWAAYARAKRKGLR